MSQLVSLIINVWCHLRREVQTVNSRELPSKHQPFTIVLTQCGEIIADMALLKYKKTWKIEIIFVTNI